MILKAGVKAGRLANGFERGKGKIIHAIDISKSCTYSLCGESPANSWAEREIDQINCSKCIKQMKKESK